MLKLAAVIMLLGDVASGGALALRATSLKCRRQPSRYSPRAASGSLCWTRATTSPLDVGDDADGCGTLDLPHAPMRPTAHRASNSAISRHARQIDEGDAV